MRHAMTRRWGLLVAAALAVQAGGCGTLFYPERKGQEDGKVDPKVAILDGIGLLFFIIPGVIAFIVDFDNGTIYLPGTHRDHSRDTDSRAEAPVEEEIWAAVRVGPAGLDAAAIREVVGRNTGTWIDLDDPRLEISRVGGASPGAGPAARGRVPAPVYGVVPPSSVTAMVAVKETSTSTVAGKIPPGPPVPVN
jgi:hypothetical protein